MITDPSKVPYNTRALAYAYKRYNRQDNDPYSAVNRLHFQMTRHARDIGILRLIAKRAGIPERTLQLAIAKEYNSSTLHGRTRSTPVVPDMFPHNYFLYSRVLMPPPNLKLDHVAYAVTYQLGRMMMMYAPSYKGHVLDILERSRLTYIEQRALFRHAYTDDIANNVIKHTNTRPIPPSLIPNLHHSNLRAAELYTILYPQDNVLSGLGLSDISGETLAAYAATYLTPYDLHPLLFPSDDNEETFSFTKHKHTIGLPRLDEAQSLRDTLQPFFSEAVVSVGDEDYLFPAGRRRSLYEIATDPVILQSLREDKLDIYHIAHMCGFSMEIFLYLFIYPIYAMYQIMEGKPPVRLPLTFDELKTTNNQEALGVDKLKLRTIFNYYKAIGYHYDFYKQFFPFVLLFKQKQLDFLISATPDVYSPLILSQKYLKSAILSPRKW